MARKKRKKKRKVDPATDKSVIRIASPKVRLKTLFKVLDAVARTGDTALREVTDATNPVVRFDLAILQRGINTVKSIRLLLEHAHWELAATGNRQLFELLVNVEYIDSQSDREVAVFRYTKFGLLQAARQRQLAFEYDVKTGRSVDQDRKAYVAALLEKSFPEFRNKNGGWVRSWTGKNIWELTQLSQRPLRQDQYRQLFSSWSEQAHASPGALLPSLFARLDEEGGVEEIVADDDRRIAETASMAVTLFIELWWNLPSISSLDPGKAAGWLEELGVHAQKLGATPLSSE